MNFEAFEILYTVTLCFMVITEIYIIAHDRNMYIYTSLRAISRMCKNNENNSIDDLVKDINDFYSEYAQEKPKIKKFFPNVIVWINAIIFKIDCSDKKATVWHNIEKPIKQVRDKLESDKPYSKCEIYQQDILKDIEKLEVDENKIVVRNIIKRTESEFIRMSEDIKKSDTQSKLSIIIGIAGIVISIITALLKR